MSEQVILVDPRDVAIGTAEKLAAHREGRLHRAFSVFVFDGAGRALLQRRSPAKYHSGGLWSNTCCSHPRPTETTLAAAHRRLREEMGFDCPLREAFAFTYRAELDGGLVEHEFDHVLVGVHAGSPAPSPDEVAEWRWMDLAELACDVAERGERYTIWFRAALPELLARRLPGEAAAAPGEDRARALSGRGLLPRRPAPGPTLRV